MKRRMHGIVRGFHTIASFLSHCTDRVGLRSTLQRFVCAHIPVWFRIIRRVSLTPSEEEEAFASSSYPSHEDTTTTTLSTSFDTPPPPPPFERFETFYRRYRPRIHTYPITSSQPTTRLRPNLRTQRSLPLSNQQERTEPYSLEEDYFFFDIETKTCNAISPTHSSWSLLLDDDDNDNDDDDDNDASSFPLDPHCVHATPYVLCCFVKNWVDLFVEHVPRLSAPQAVYRIRYLQSPDLIVPLPSIVPCGMPHPLLSWMSVDDMPILDEDVDDLCRHVSYMLGMWHFLRHHASDNVLVLFPLPSSTSTHGHPSCTDTNIFACADTLDVECFERYIHTFSNSDYDIAYIAHLPRVHDNTHGHHSCRVRPVDVHHPHDASSIPILYKYHVLERIFSELWRCTSTRAYREVFQWHRLHACMFTGSDETYT